MKAVAVVPPRSGRNWWRGSRQSDPPGSARDGVVALEIQGNDRDGFHLVMTPDGCFTADTWHESVEDAKEAAREAFGVPLDGWA